MKKKFSATIIALIIAVSVAVAVGFFCAIYFPIKIAEEKKEYEKAEIEKIIPYNPTDPEHKFGKTLTYFYAVGVDGGYPIDLTYDWCGDVPLEKFTISGKSDNIEIKDGKLVALPGAKANEECTFTYLYKDKEICKVIAKTVDVTKYITSEQDFASMGMYAMGNYVQTSDITFTSCPKVENYRGNYYGNNYVIDGEFCNEKSGLIKNTLSGSLNSINIIIDKEITLANGVDSFGLICCDLEKTNCNYCSVSGKLNITNGNDSIAIGGMFGYLKGNKRETISTYSKYTVQNCYTDNFQFSLNGCGKIYQGGLIGRSEEMIITNVCMDGKVVANIDDGNKLTEINIGGVVGKAERDYNKIAYDIEEYETYSNISVSADIGVTINGGEDAINRLYIGGFSGWINNNNIVSVYIDGNITVSGGGTDSFLGGVVGFAENNLSGVGNNTNVVEMTFENIEVLSPITFESVGRVHAGGVCGNTQNIVISNVVYSPMPSIIGERGKTETEVNAIVGKVRG